MPLRFIAFLALTFLLTCSLPAGAAELVLDYAYYNPLSLVLRETHGLERRLGPEVTVRWVLSAGSNKALEFIRSRSVAIASMAGSAALLGRANGTPLRVVYVFARAEWTAIVVPAQSPIRRLEDLRGRRVAATPGTDPAIFLFRALARAGLDRTAITLVPLQHQEGRLALDRGNVDAWAGLDPFMAEAELSRHDRLVFRDPSLITPGVLVTSESFAATEPDRLRLILAAYEEARRWALAHPAELTALLAKTSGLPAEVAARQLARTDFSQPHLTAADQANLRACGEVLAASGTLRPGSDPAALAAALPAPDFPKSPFAEPNRSP
jgi:sulfonate transport system substrate-binding protein